MSGAAFVPDIYSEVEGARLYRTGDWARRRGDGSLEYCGRRDGRMVLGGVRVEAEEMETILVEHAGVGEAAVVMRELPGEHEGSLVAVMVKEEGQASGQTSGQTMAEIEEELRTLLQERMGEGIRLKSVVVVEKIARNAEGGIDRGAVVRMVEQRETAGAEPEYAAARTEVEKILSGIWAGVLNLEQVGIHDNFFKLGGETWSR